MKSLPTGGEVGPERKVAHPPETNCYKLLQDADCIPLSACILDLAQERVLRGDSVVPLTTRESRLLRYLWERQGEDVSRVDLLVDVWGYSPRARSRAVDATVQRLRGKIERDSAAPDHLRTVWGNGYRFVALRIASPDDRWRARVELERALATIGGGPVADAIAFFVNQLLRLDEGAGGESREGLNVESRSSRTHRFR